MKVLTLSVHDIEVGERLRALSDDAVDRLAASMRDIGLRQPITVRIVEEMEVDGYLTAGVPVLVAGRHRLAAARSLGWETIECIEVEDDAISAEMWEIAENLHRLDLKPAERDEHLRRYIELVERRRASERIVEQNVKQSVGRPKSVVTEVAEATGVAPHTVRRAMRPQPTTRELVDVVDPFDAITAQADAIVRAWNRACPEARQMAMDQIDGPLMDRAA